MSEHFGIAVIVLLFGLPSATIPYRMAKLEEAIDAIGSKRKSSEVEPAEWKVLLTRIVGVLMVLYGVAVVAGVL